LNSALEEAEGEAFQRSQETPKRFSTGLLCSPRGSDDTENELVGRIRAALS